MGPAQAGDQQRLDRPADLPSHRRRATRRRTRWAARQPRLDFAVTFDPGFDTSQTGCTHSVPHLNAQGVDQGSCVHCGNCDIGCPVDAKNTLDRNYLAMAEAKGAEIRPLHLVTGLERDAGGWRVHFDRLADNQRQPSSVTAQRVIVAGGTLNSTEFLLRYRISASAWVMVGAATAIYGNRKPEPSRGPTITCAIDFLDRSHDGQSFWIQDGGVPNLLADLAAAREVKHPKLD